MVVDAGKASPGDSLDAVGQSLVSPASVAAASPVCRCCLQVSSICGKQAVSHVDRGIRCGMQCLDELEGLECTISL